MTRLIAVVLLFVGHGGSSRDATANEMEATMRLFYWYYPQDASHVEHYVQLQDLVEAADCSIHFTGFRAEKPEFAGISASVLSPVIIRQAKQGDFALLLKADGQPHSQGSGNDMERIVRSLSTGHISTDIDESTWGKIKELFQ